MQASTNWIDQGAQALPAYAASPPLEGGTTAGGEPEPGAAAPAKDGVGLNGGWPTREIGGPDAGRRCNIERRTGLSKPEFLREYADKNRPVILKGLLDDWPATTTWRRDEFVAKYGAYNVTLRKSSDVAYDNEFGGTDDFDITLIHPFFARYHYRRVSSAVSAVPCRVVYVPLPAVSR